LLKSKGKGFGVHRLKLLENSVLRKIFGFKKEEVIGGWKNLTIGKKKLRQRIIATERPPLVGEVSANFSG
jgi:hypothetical protein